MELEEDLLARQEARNLCRRAEEAAAALGAMPQEQLDRIAEAVAEAFAAKAKELAELAVAETGFGNVRDKTEKNRFASEDVAKAIRGMKTVGILSQRAGLWEIGVPVGVIAAIVPSTNPTSTVCYKSLIALKSGNAVIFSPHPKAARCTRAAADLVREAARKAGAPEGAVGCLGFGSMAGCRELMQAPQVRLILATGGPAMVRAAYSSGKPAIGVGAGNGPAYIHRSADVGKALDRIGESKTFDNGTVCASEQSIIVEKDMEGPVLEAAEKRGFYLMTRQQAESLGKLLFRPDGSLNPEIVGKTAEKLAEKAGFSAPAGTKILMAREQDGPYAEEKLCPVLAFFTEENEEAVLKKSVALLRREGQGHTFSIHAEDEAVIRRFAEKIPVSRFLVNTPAAQGGVGLTTGLFPALTLGCGAAGGSSSSNNISPLDLINIRRVAWGDGKAPAPQEDLVDQITAKIMKMLNQKG